MKIFHLVKLNALLASIFPIIIGILFNIYKFNNINLLYTFIYVLTVISIDLIVIIMDTMDDYKTAKSFNFYDILKDNPIEIYNLPIKNVKQIIHILIIMVILLGLYLVIKIGILLFIIGILGLLTAIGYSKFLHNFPIGEFLSGFFMGFLIPFTLIYVNNCKSNFLNFNNIFSILLVTLPEVLWIANILLANNICDIKYDRITNRITYPIYVGKRKAILTFEILNAISFISVIISVTIKLEPWTNLIIICLVPYVNKQCKIFKKIQDKSSTFKVAPKILLLGSIFQCSAFLIYLL